MYEVFSMKIRFLSWYATLLFFVISATAGDSPRKSLAFTPLTASGIDEYDATVFNEQLRNEIEKLGVYATREFCKLDFTLLVK